jgi:hypothetical protein
MLAAIITLSLLSLLVATEADPADSRHEPTGDEPLRPPGQRGDRDGRDGGKRDQLAA